MTSEDLARYIDRIVSTVQGRVLTVGQEQYSEGDTQQFERMNLLQITDYLLEEIQDSIAYNVMLHHKAERLKDAIHAAFTGTTATPAQVPTTTADYLSWTGQ